MPADSDDLGDVVLVLKQPLDGTSLIELSSAIFSAVFRGPAPQRLRVQLAAGTCALIRTDAATPSRLAIARDSVDIHGAAVIVERILRRAPVPFDVRPTVLACMQLALLEQDLIPGPQHSAHVTSWSERATVHFDLTDEDVAHLLFGDSREQFVIGLTTRLRVSREKFDVQIWRPAQPSPAVVRGTRSRRSAG